MEYIDSDNLTSLAKLVLYKTGLERCFSDIFFIIGREISEMYDNDSIGYCRYDYSAVDEGKFAYPLNKRLNDSEKVPLLRFIAENNFEISAERNSSGSM